MSIIEDLEQELIGKNCDIASALRKAKVISRKLKLDKFSEWIDNELNGYANDAKLPLYRKNIKGQVKYFNPYHGWQAFVFGDADMEKLYTVRVVFDSVPKLIELSNGENNGQFAMEISGGMLELLWKKQVFGPLETYLIIDRSVLVDIIERVKNALLDWLLLLEEEGIVGEGISFTQQESENAQKSATIHNFIVNIYGDMNSSTISKA